ncbi:MAG: hypothetical protein PVG89_14050, partial [Gammaproteobacteria bacterium]
MKLMHGSFHNSRATWAAVLAFLFLSLLAGCGQDDPLLEASGDEPIIENFAIAYIKRPVDALHGPRVGTSFPPEFDDPNEPTVGISPGDVYVRDLSSISAEERNITSSITAPILGVKSAGDVSDLEVSYDGTKLIFSMHEGMYEGRMPEEQPTWQIWAYDLIDETLQRVTDDVDADSFNHLDPYFLPDGRIVFTSDRRTTSRTV